MPELEKWEDTGKTMLGILCLVLGLWIRLIDLESHIFQMEVEIMGVVKVTSQCVCGNGSGIRTEPAITGNIEEQKEKRL